MTKLHINWSACRDWHAVRARVHFLRANVGANFADMEGDCDAVKSQLEVAGFHVSMEPYIHNTTMLRLSE